MYRVVTNRRQKSGLFVTSLLWALTPYSPVKESSGENAAMVLKNVKASQGNVYPVDISGFKRTLFRKTNALQIIPQIYIAPVSLRIWLIY